MSFTIASAADVRVRNSTLVRSFRTGRIFCSRMAASSGSAGGLLAFALGSWRFLCRFRGFDLPIVGKFRSGCFLVGGVQILSRNFFLVVFESLSVTPQRPAEAPRPPPEKSRGTSITPLPSNISTIAFGNKISYTPQPLPHLEYHHVYIHYSHTGRAYHRSEYPAPLPRHRHEFCRVGRPRC